MIGLVSVPVGRSGPGRRVAQGHDVQDPTCTNNTPSPRRILLSGPRSAPVVRTQRAPNRYLPIASASRPSTTPPMVVAARPLANFPRQP
jgi:hypothetical protein